MTGILSFLAASDGIVVPVTITPGSGAGLIGWNSGGAIGNPISSTTVGSIQTPAGGTLPSGKDIINLSDIGGNATLIIWPFNSANPGKQSLLAVTLNGVTLLASAATFSYGGVVPNQYAQWSWGSAFGLSAGVQQSGTIIKSSSTNW